MKPDMTISWDEHLKNGNVWQVEVELAMQGGESDEQLYYSVTVDVVSPTQALAQYIVATMYPEHAAIFVSDEPRTSA
tara:strand:- start:398 stop:628 length:231 start_codon:yes stop_codon:yes gene_type:complete